MDKTFLARTYTKPHRAINRVFIHCSATDAEWADDVSIMRRWHVCDREWNDVGYHFFIRKDGRIQPGRHVELTPAAQSGHNARTIAICVHGLDAEKFTPAQFANLKLLCSAINEEHNKSITFHGHCEVAAKSCPVFDYKAVLGLDEAGYMV